MSGALTVVPLTGMGEVGTGDDLAALLLAATRDAGLTLRHDDVLVVSSKVLAKALGLWADDRDTAIVAESRGVVAERRTPNGITRIVRAAAGPVMAAAGVDASNTGSGASGRVLLLPHDPDAHARRLREDVHRLAGVRPAVLLTDTSGRPWRVGQTDFALGCAGLLPTEDLRGGVDADGAPLQVTVRAVADELAGAAELVKGKASGVPAALARGCRDLVTAADGPGAGGLVRFDAADWFATGTVESVRAALGCPPGTPGVEPAPAVPDPDPVAVLTRSAAVVVAGIAADGLRPDGTPEAGADADLASVQVAAGPRGVLVTGAAVPPARVAERVVVAARAEGLRTTVVAQDAAGGAHLTVAAVPRA